METNHSVENMNWNHAIKLASEGASVLIVGKDVIPLSAHIGGGSIYVRRSDQEWSLKSVSVNIVWFIGTISDRIQQLCMFRTTRYLDIKVYFTP